MENVQPRTSRTRTGENCFYVNGFSHNLFSPLAFSKTQKKCAYTIILDETKLLQRASVICRFDQSFSTNQIFSSTKTSQDLSHDIAQNKFPEKKYIDWMAMQELHSRDAGALILQKQNFLHRFLGGTIFIRKGNSIFYLLDESNLYLKQTKIFKIWQSWLHGIMDHKELQQFSWIEKQTGQISVADLWDADELWAYHFINGIIGLSLQDARPAKTIGKMAAYLVQEFDV